MRNGTFFNVMPRTHHYSPLLLLCSAQRLTQTLRTCKYHKSHNIHSLQVLSERFKPMKWFYTLGSLEFSPVDLGFSLRVAPHRPRVHHHTPANRTVISVRAVNTTRPAGLSQSPVRGNARQNPSDISLTALQQPKNTNSPSSGPMGDFRCVQRRTSIW